MARGLAAGSTISLEAQRTHPGQPNPPPPLPPGSSFPWPPSKPSWLFSPCLLLIQWILGRSAARACLLARRSSGLQLAISVAWLCSPQRGPRSPGGTARPGRPATGHARQRHPPSFEAGPPGKPRCRAGADLPFRLLRLPEGPAASWGRGSRAPARGRRGAAAPIRAAPRRAALWNTEFTRKTSAGNALPTKPAFTWSRGRGEEEPPELSS